MKEYVMKKCLLLLLLSAAFYLPATAQFTRYVVRLKNKTGSPYSIGNPSQFLTQRAINRRTRYGISIDETDLPIPQRYIDSIRLAGNVTIVNYSKWLNQVCIVTDAAALGRINGYPFVQSSSPVAARLLNGDKAVNKQLDPPSSFRPADNNNAQRVTDVYSYGSSYDQVHLHNAEFLHNYGFRGQGMQLAVIDDGFYNYQTLPNFDSARNNGQILGTWDFVTSNSSVNEDDSHGMKCFSTIASNMPGSFVGTAPAASFYLYRTEDIATEYPIEEQNFAVAAERADSLGVDVFSVSLGYNTFDNSSFNHTYSELNGNTTIIAKASNMAAKKGILMVAAAGNDGNNSWHYIATPGDADSVLTIGAVNTSRQVAGFSGYGPNSDGQIKPDVAAVGASAVVAGTSTGAPVFGNGTSFACPIMAGITTCLWQAFPEVKNMDIMQGLRQASDRYTTPDDRSGYGIPDVKKAFVSFIQKLHTQSAAINNCNAIFNWSIKAAAGMNIVVERKLPSDADYVAINTQYASGTFINKSFSYTDSLSNYTGGVNILYRLKMVIGTDTSFYVDSVVLAYTNQCTTVTERKICPATATYFSVDPLPGYTYKWQVNTGSGFVDVSENALYTGSFENVLIINNPPRSYYGYQYRCVQTNGSSTLYSTPVTLKFASTWTGGISTAWENSANWSCSIVPDQYIDVIIKNGVPNYPVVNTNAVCHSVSSSSGVSVIVKTGVKLDIVGH